MNLYKFFYLVIIFPVVVSSQVNQEWVARYNGSGNGDDYAKSLTLDGFGNVYITGHSIGTNTNNDFLTIKYNSAGDSVWIQRYHNFHLGHDYAKAIAVDINGNVFVTGLSDGDSTAYDYATIKYNPDGIQEWVQRYDGMNTTDEPKDIAVDNTGNVYVTGYSYTNGVNSDYLTIKYNSSGVQQWVQRYNGTANAQDCAYSIKVDLSGNVYITGESRGSNTLYDYVTIKYNSAGVQQWIQRYDAAAKNDKACSITIDNFGNILVTGSSESGTPYNDYLTIKYNSQGVQQWISRYDEIASDVPISIVVDSIGNSYVTGSSRGSSSSDDFATVKYNVAGVQQWVQRYNGPGNANDNANSIALDNFGNIYVTGSSPGMGSDYATVKYNADGVFQWLQRYNGPGSSDFSQDIAVDNNGNVFVTGHSNANGFYDYATIKYSQPIGITSISTETPDGFQIGQNYPNPFNPITNIEFNIPKASIVRISVYDLLGREIESLVNQNLNAGSYKVDWDASKYPSGIYYYKITAGSFIETKKMVLVK